VSNDLDSLTEEHVRQLGRIIEALEKSTFDYLQLEVGDLKVTVGKGGVLPDPAVPAARPASPPPAVSAVAAAAPAAVPAQPQAQASGQAAAAPASLPPAAEQGAVEVKSPIMGMFYAQPEPGAAPFVQVGSSVAAETTVALVEVMKTFNAVSAGVSGRVVEVCVKDAQLVEFGQVLFRVIPE